MAMTTDSAPEFDDSFWGRTRETFRNVEPLTLISVLLVIGAVWIFGAVADEVVEGDTRGFDESVLQALRQVGASDQLIGPEWLEYAMINITSLGGAPVASLLLAIVICFLLLRRAWIEAAVVTVASLGGLAVGFGLKALFDRPRPSVVPHLVSVSDPSFPSGHAMISAVIYLTLGTLIASFLVEKKQKAYVLFVAVILTLLVGASRVLLGVHYPTDVLGGWMVGLAWALICWLGTRYVEHKLTPAEFELEGAKEEAEREQERKSRQGLEATA